MPLSVLCPSNHWNPKYPGAYSNAFLGFRVSRLWQFCYDDPGSFGLLVCEMSKFHLWTISTVQIFLWSDGLDPFGILRIGISRLVIPRHAVLPKHEVRIANLPKLLFRKISRDRGLMPRISSKWTVLLHFGFSWFATPNATKNSVNLKP